MSCVRVDARKLQAAILAPSSREISQTVHIDCHSVLSHVRISVRPSNFFYRRNTSAKNECSVDRQRHVEMVTSTTVVIPLPATD